MPKQLTADSKLWKKVDSFAYRRHELAGRIGESLRNG
jgi:hypothetical protein